MPSDHDELMRGISVIVPVYQSAAILPELIQRLDAALSRQERHFEVILVNDGSPDNSWEVVKALAEDYAWIRGVDLMRNFGQHNALLCGIRLARYDVTVTIDDDLQNPPEEIESLSAKLREGYDVVYGTPLRQQHGLWRDMASSVSKLMLEEVMGARTARRVSAFRAFRTHLRDAFADYRSPSVSIDVLLTWGTNRFTAVKVRHDPRASGKSNYNFRRLVQHAFNMITGFSTFPLHIASWIGFLFTAFGMVILVFVLLNYLIKGGGVPGFPFLASIVAIFSGAQLFALGMIGEYLARIHWRTMNRPPFAVRSTTDDPGVALRAVTR